MAPRLGILALESDALPVTFNRVGMYCLPDKVHDILFYHKFEPPHGKTNNVVSKQAQHKPTCTVAEKS